MMIDTYHEVRYDRGDYYYVAGRFLDLGIATLFEQALSRSGFDAEVKSYGFDDDLNSIKEGDQLFIVHEGQIADPEDDDGYVRWSVEEMMDELGYDMDQISIRGFGLYCDALGKINGVIFASNEEEALDRVAKFAGVKVDGEQS